MVSWNQKIIELGKPRIISLPKLTLTSIRNTIVTCTQCYGTRTIIVKRSNGTMYRKKCFSCHGSGQTYISPEGLSHR